MTKSTISMVGMILMVAGVAAQIVFAEVETAMRVGMTGVEVAAAAARNMRNTAPKANASTTRM